MNEFLTWTEAHQAALIAISTVVTAAATVILTWLTGSMVGENRRLRKAGTEPELVAYLLPDERTKILLNFVLANIGQGPARNVMFSFIGDEENFKKHEVRLSNNPRRTAISMLPQGEKLVAYFGRGPNLYQEPRLKPFDVKVEYENIDGKKCIRKYKLDVSQFDGLSSLGTPADYEMAQALKKIANEVVKWSEHSRLKINVVTQREQEKKHQQWLDSMSEPTESDNNVS